MMILRRALFTTVVFFSLFLFFVELFLNNIQFGMRDVTILAKKSDDNDHYNLRVQYYLQPCMIKKIKFLLLVSAVIVPLALFYYLGRMEQIENEEKNRKIDDETKHKPLIDKV